MRRCNSKHLLQHQIDAKTFLRENRIPIFPSLQGTPSYPRSSPSNSHVLRTILGYLCQIDNNTLPSRSRHKEIFIWMWDKEERGHFFYWSGPKLRNESPREVPMKTKFALSADDKAHLRKLRETGLRSITLFQAEMIRVTNHQANRLRMRSSPKDWFAQRDGEQAKLIKKVSDIDFGLAMLSAYSDATKRTVSINVLAHRTKDKDLPTLAMEIPLIQYVSALGRANRLMLNEKSFKTLSDFDDVKVVVSMFWAMDSR